VNEPEPYLSIVLTGRNDNHGGDFNERFFRALRFNRELLDAAGLDYELVFVEWAPLRDRPYLAELLIEQMPDPARLTVYIVDPRYQDAFVQNPKLRFMEFVAKNVGIRRARGTFVLTSNTDIYYSSGLVGRLGRGDLEVETLFRSTRIDLKLGADLTHVDPSLLEDPRNHVVVNTMRPPLFTNGAGDFLLLDRTSYHRMRGFNEVYRVAKIQIDGNFCAKAYANGYRIADIGAPIYHLNHVGSFTITKSLYRDHPEDAPWGDHSWYSGVVYENPESWGLGLAPCRRLDERVNALEFSWEAAPPLVDLQRVLLPGVRTGQEGYALRKPHRGLTRARERAEDREPVRQS
jgi:hypothetical protein